MEHFVVTASAVRQRTECAIVGVFERGSQAAATEELDRRCGGVVARLIKRGDFRGKLGECVVLGDLGTAPCARLLVVGLGAADKFNRKNYRKALAGSLSAVLKTGARDAVSYLSLEKIRETDAYYAARCLADVTANALYKTPDLKTAKKTPAPALKRLGIAVADRSDRAAAERGLQDGGGIAVAAKFMRDLANLPPNVCTPTYIGNAAKGVARDHRNVSVRILNEADIRRLKMGAFLSVTNGTEEPARFIVAEYRGAKSGSAPIVLVGKGVTFDTGGISLKPPPAMDEMKFDMSGAATVLGVLKGVAALQLPLNLVAIVPACENMPSGRATKPGDIVKTMSGQTVEILNTDAEGRLILCDALTYARRFKPDTVIDVATLTGACVVALGNHLSGLFANNDSLAADLLAAGNRADDRAWHLPIADEYGDQLKSNFADFANVAGREGGAITAACYLAKFTKDLNWAHLDVAGTAYQGGAHKGSTGRPVGLLMDYLLSRAR